MIKLASPQIEEDDLRAVRDVLISGMLVQGIHAAQFEEELARRIGVNHAVAVSSGTAALHLSLLALGIGEGNRVAVPAFSWPATANVVTVSGATPVFVDIDPFTFNMDPSRLRDTLEANEIDLIMPVHAFGAMAPMTEILQIAGGIPVLEDAAGALGAELDGRAAGTWGVAGCFSFHPRKTITTGEGGAVVTDDEAVASTVRALRNHGLAPGVVGDFVMPGFNLRLTDFQAALGRTQLAKLGLFLDSRRRQADLYHTLLEGSRVTPQATPPQVAHGYQAFVCLVDGLTLEQRSLLIALLRDRGVEVTIGTYHIPLTSWHRQAGGYQPGRFPVTDDVFVRTIALPFHYSLTSADQERVVELLLEELDASEVRSVHDGGAP